MRESKLARGGDIKGERERGRERRKRARPWPSRQCLLHRSILRSNVVHELKLPLVAKTESQFAAKASKGGKKKKKVTKTKNASRLPFFYSDDEFANFLQLSSSSNKFLKFWRFLSLTASSVALARWSSFVGSSFRQQIQLSVSERGSRSS